MDVVEWVDGMDTMGSMDEMDISTPVDSWRGNIVVHLGRVGFMGACFGRGGGGR